MTTLLDAKQQAENKAIEATLLQEWKPEHFKSMQKAIVNHFKGKYFSGRYYHFQPELRTFPRLAEIFGFAYTSSSLYAGYWVCNDEITTSKIAPYHYVGFALSSENKAFALLRDDKENDIYLPL